jgi:uncharacterized protein (DUF1800 family)
MKGVKRAAHTRASFIKSFYRPAAQAEKMPVPTDGVNLLSEKGLNVYQGPWGDKQVLHLLRRCLFGVKLQELKHFSTLNMEQCLNELFAPVAAPAPPVNAYNGSQDKDHKITYSDPYVAAGQTWVRAPYGPLRPGLSFGDRQNALDEMRRLSLKGWWAGIMINQSPNITEKMVLFWTTAISTQIKSVLDARYSYKYLELLRRYATGNFKQLIREVTTDPQMLVYQNGNTNTASAPNENYARELQELFTVGKSPGPHFTEEDVRTAARLLTGWTDNFTSPESTEVSSGFVPGLHDTSDKQFSAIYGNTVIKGRTGADGAKELDDLVDMIFKVPQTAKTLCRKLYRFFVYYKIDDNIEKNVIEPLAEILVANNFETAPVLKALFKSEHFYDNCNMGCMIKNPVDFVIGMLRQFNVVLPGADDYVAQYVNWIEVTSLMFDTGMDIGEPPGVAGWPAYYQAPQYHRLWLDSDTLPNRNTLSSQLLTPGGTTRNGAHIKLDYMQFTAQLTDAGNPDALVEESIKLLCAVAFDRQQFRYVKRQFLLSSEKEGDMYWTQAWNNYIKQPGNKSAQEEVESRLLRYYTYLLSRAEFQMN